MNGTRLEELASRLLSLSEEHGTESLIAAARLLWERTANPRAYVCVVGETSSGKSTLLNTLFARPLLSTGVTPTQGTIVQVRLAEGVEIQRAAVNRDATVEELSPDQFAHYEREPDDELLRLQLVAPPREASFSGLDLFDTPGFNSMTPDHERVLLDMLTEADALVFLVNYRTGFGETHATTLGMILETVRGSRQGSVAATPVILTVNAVPEGREDDKRVSSIIEQFREYVPVPAAVVRVGVLRKGQPVGSDALDAWRPVAEVALGEIARDGLQRTMAELLMKVAGELEDHVAGRLLASQLSQADRDAILEQLKSVEESAQAAEALIAGFEERCRRLTKASVVAGVERASKELSQQILASNKWTGRQECLQFVQEYVMPRECGRINHEAQDVMSTELDRLDRELEDLANTVVERLETVAQASRGAGAAVLRRFAGNVAYRVAGGAVARELGRLGGRGGLAAGAGNLVKKLVKKVGGAFGKNFGRDVYTRIGKVFTKRFVAWANVVLTVAVEAALFVWEANTWQAGFAKESEKSLGRWSDELITALHDEFIPELGSVNRRQVQEAFQVMAQELRAQMDTTIGLADDEMAMLREARSRIQTLKSECEALLEES